MRDCNSNQLSVNLPSNRTSKKLLSSKLDLWFIAASCFVAVLGALCYINSLDGDFVFDDTEAVVNNEDVKPNNPWVNLFYNDFWGTRLSHTVSHKSYRPLAVLSFRLSYWLSDGLNPRAFHLVNILLHGLVCLLSVPVFCLLLDELKPKFAFICSLIFALHPVHTEAVVAVVGRADLLCAVFFFASFLSYAHATTQSHPYRAFAYLVWSMLCCAIAMFCKEQGITVLGVNSVYDLVASRVNLREVLPRCVTFIKSPQSFVLRFNSCFGRHLISLFTGLVLLYARWQIMGSMPNFQPVDNPAAFAESWLTRVGTYNFLYSLNMWLMLCPDWLCFDWSMGCIPLLQSFQDARFLCVIIFWFTLSRTVYLSLFSSDAFERRRLTMALALLIIPFLPASNLFFKVGFVLAERVLYVPLMGYCVLISHGLDKLWRSFPNSKVLWLGGVLSMSFFVLKSVHRSGEWLSEETLFKSALRVCPLNAKVHYNIAKNAADAGQAVLAISEYRKALQLHPDYDQAMNNLANLLKDEGQLAEAQYLLRRAVEIRSDFAAAWMNLGIVEALLKNPVKAEMAYSTALQYRKRYPDCYYNLGNLFLDLGQYEAAIAAYRNATNLQPLHILSWSNMIVLLDNMGEVTKAEAVANEALTVLPDEASLHFSLANVLGKQGRFAESEAHFLQAVKGKPLNPMYHTNLGVLYHRWKLYSEAEGCYLRALKLDADFKSAKENLKLLRRVWPPIH